MAAMQVLLPMQAAPTKLAVAEAAVTTTVDPSPGLDPFLRTEASFGIAAEAYKIALQALQASLNRTELADLQSTRSIEELQVVAEKARKRWLRSQKKGRLERLVEILDHYSPVLDTLSQSHSEYTALLWGSIKWLLQVSMNYLKLIKRLSAMLEDIGDNLPRFMLYERILPTDHMARIISKLYAAIIQFLYEAIAFWKSHKMRKFVIAFWSPFETKFGDTVEKIRRLQECVEKDAVATEMAQRRRETLRFDDQLRELSLVTRHTLQSILDVKERQATLLLITIRQQLFASFACKSDYQEECIKVYTTFITPEWEEIRKKEAQISWLDHSPQSRLTYVQLEAVEPAIGVGQLIHDRKFSRVNRIFMFWGPAMTKESALAALIVEILVKHAEKLLYRENFVFYIEKFGRCTPTFDQLWTIFTEIMSALPELHCTVQVASYEPEATEFVTRLVQFAVRSQHGKLDLLIYHTTINALSSTPGWIELDNEYDVDFDLNSCDAFFRLILLEEGHYENLSETMQTYMRQQVWRSLRYNLMAVTFHQTCLNFWPAIRQHDDSCLLVGSQIELPSHKQASALLKRRIIAFLQLIPHEMSPAMEERLRAAVSALKHQVSDAASASGTDSQILESKVPIQPTPPDSEQRAHIWAAVQTQFEAVISELFGQKILDTLSDTVFSEQSFDSEIETDVILNIHNDTSSQDETGNTDIKGELSGSARLQIMDRVGRQVFSQDQWSTGDLTAAQIKLEEVLMNAARTGVELTERVILPL